MLKSFGNSGGLFLAICLLNPHFSEKTRFQTLSRKPERLTYFVHKVCKFVLKNTNIIKNVLIFCT